MSASSAIRHDFRSDTVTRPGPGMRQAMAEAEVGDDVFGDDPTVKRLETRMAELLGKEEGLFVSSGTQSNLLALMSHCGRGDEYIVGQYAHCYRWEQGGAAVLGSIQPQPIANAPDGTLPLEEIEKAIKPDDAHFARTRVVALENTIGGKILPQTYVVETAALARRHGLGVHLDGARAFNAAAAQNMAIAELVAPADTVSICLSKGLGAPVGSVLSGPAALINKARRYRKMLGGGMRQAGIIAAGGLYALEHNVGRLGEDHINASRLAAGLAKYPGLKVEMPQTNILWVHLDADVAEPLNTYLQHAGIGLTSAYGGLQQRWVTHLDVGAKSVDAALVAVAGFFDRRNAA